MKLYGIIITALISVVRSNQVSMIATPSNQLVGSYPVQYQISINRVKDNNGRTITASQINIPIAVKLTFPSTYTINSSVNVTNYSETLNEAQNSLTITIDSQPESLDKLNFVIQNLNNPLVSEKSQIISAKISENSQTVDTATTSLQFQTRQINTSAISWQLEPGTVSTISNLTMTLQMSLWSSGMHLVFTFPEYWERQLIYTEQRMSFNSQSSTCSPACNISQGSSNFDMTFNTIQPPFTNNHYEITVVFHNMRSPPTLQLKDAITINTIQPEYNTVIQSTNKLFLGSTVSGVLPLSSASTTNAVNSPITIVLSFQTRNYFGADDTITVNLGPDGQLLPSVSTENITLNSSFINSHLISLQDNNTIILSSFDLLVSSPTVISGEITIQGIEPASSTKPITGNRITFDRYSFEYNTAQFEFSVEFENLTGFINVTNNFANRNVSLSITINLVVPTQTTDHIFIKIPSTITVNTCIPQCDSGCVCNNESTSLFKPFTILDISQLPSDVNELVVGGTGTNPIASNQSIQVCSTDSENYTKQCGIITYPPIQSATLPTQTLQFTMTNNIVNALSDYTLLYNFTNYSLQDGFLITQLPDTLTLINPSHTICYINGQISCIFSSTDPVIINSTVTSTIKIYNITLKNIRNPKTTQPFLISGQVTNVDHQVYYKIRSQYSSDLEPYTLLHETHFQINSQTNCTNYATNNITIQFITLPFQLSSDYTSDLIYQMTNTKTNVTTNYLYSVSSQFLQFRIINWDSFEVITYEFVLLTSDQLYKIFKFNYRRQNCEPTYLIINSYEFTGLPEDSGTLQIIFNRIYSNITDYSIQLNFPSEYPQQLTLQTDNSSTIHNIAPRQFRITVPADSQPILIKVWNFTNVMNSQFFRLAVYDQGQYLVSANNDTVSYKLANMSDCVFPCKLCEETTVCRSCFSSNLTIYYILDTVNEQCGVNCPNGTYLNTIQCLRCPAQCSKCTSESSCLQCVNNFYFLNNSCLTDCPDKYYPNNSTNSCEKCKYPCINCVSQQICLSCSNGYNLQTNSCLTECLSNYIPVQDSNPSQYVCRRCQAPCEQCASQITTCISCISNFYLHEQNCVQNCPELLIGYQQQCVSCDICYTCRNNQPTICTSCSNQFKLYNYSCVLDCPSDYYESSSTGAGNGSVCLQCAPQCSLCSAFDSCSECSDGYYLNAHQCLVSCPTEMFAQNNSNGKFICYNCQDDCLECNNFASCVSCARGTYLINGLCVSECPNTSYPDSGTCKNCSTGCLQCYSSTSCQQCSISYTLHEGQCSRTCPEQWVSVNHSCIQCSSHISHCLLCDPLECSQCKPGFYLQQNAASADQICSLSCPEGTVKSTTTGANPISICQSCDSTCTRCQGHFNNCTGCKSGYNFYNSRCELNCPSLFIAINQQCTACSNPCRTCSQSITNCESCQSGYLLQNQCFEQCPQKYYQSNQTTSCVSCQSGCYQCIQNGCLRCLTGYFTTVVTVESVNYYQCYEVCPTHLPYITNESECVECSEYCLQCSNNKCLECQTNYNRYGQQCVIQCPNPLIVSNSQCIQKDDVIVTPQTNEPQPQPQPQSTGTDIPMPFTIILFCVILCCFASKFQNKATLTTMCILGTAAVIAPICNITYLITIWSVNNNFNITTLLYILIGSLAINYVTNIVHTIFSFMTYRKDEKFIEYAEKCKYGNWIMMVMVLLTENLSFVLYFCRLFNLLVFKASLNNLLCLRYLNYLWGVTLIHNIVAAVVSIIMLIDDSTFLLQSIDILVVNLSVLIFGMMLFRKSAQDWRAVEKLDDETNSYSSKKVIFEEGVSHESINVDVETMGEVNGKITSKLIETRNQVANQYEVGELQEQSKDMYFVNSENNENYQSNEPSKSNQPSKSNDRFEDYEPSEGNELSEDQKHSESNQNSEDNETMKIEQLINLELCADQMKPEQMTGEHNCEIHQNIGDEIEVQEVAINQVEALNAEQFVKKQSLKNIFEESVHQDASDLQYSIENKKSTASLKNVGGGSPLAKNSKLASPLSNIDKADTNKTGQKQLNNIPKGVRKSINRNSQRNRYISTSPFRKSKKSNEMSSKNSRSNHLQQKVETELGLSQVIDEEQSNQQSNPKQAEQVRLKTFGRQQDSEAITNTLNEQSKVALDLQVVLKHAEQQGKTPVNKRLSKSKKSNRGLLSQRQIKNGSSINRHAKRSEGSSDDERTFQKPTPIPVSFQTLPINSELKYPKERKLKQLKDNNNHSNRNHRNFSSNKTSKPSIIYQNPNLSSDRISIEEKPYKIEDPKSLIRQIQRKQKLRSQQQSLKNIYLRK